MKENVGAELFDTVVGIVAVIVSCGLLFFL